MINDLRDNLQINLFEGADGFINFSLPIIFDGHFLLPEVLLAGFGKSFSTRGK
jgi:hypothetical protein